MKSRAGIQEIHFLPFNPTYKQTALTYVDSEGKMCQVTKCAPEQILNLSRNKSVIVIQQKVHAVIDKFAERGLLRSLAVAYQEVPEEGKKVWEVHGTSLVSCNFLMHPAMIVQIPLEGL